MQSVVPLHPAPVEATDNNFSSLSVSDLSLRPRQPMSVLVADDDAFTRASVMRRLEAWGYSPQGARTGPEAVAKLADREGPRLALVDWEMPGMTGVQVCRTLLQRQHFGRPYIVIMTGRHAGEEVVRALRAGASDYIRKPMDDLELRARLLAGVRIVEYQAQILEAQALLEERATRDGLTGLVNRQVLMDSLGREVARSLRTSRPLSLVFFDIDNFKRVNDTYGHAVGDDVLVEVGVRCVDATRRSDVLGRYGGEEFLLIAPECPLEQAARLAERLRLAMLESRIRSGKHHIPVTGSFGVASTSQGFANAQSLLRAADQALYLAKGRGRNRTCIAVPLQ